MSDDSQEQPNPDTVINGKSHSFFATLMFPIQSQMVSSERRNRAL
jgi:hypothetical protein